MQVGIAEVDVVWKILFRVSGILDAPIRWTGRVLGNGDNRNERTNEHGSGRAKAVFHRVLPFRCRGAWLLEFDNIIHSAQTYPTAALRVIQFQHQTSKHVICRPETEQFSQRHNHRCCSDRLLRDRRSLCLRMRIRTLGAPGGADRSGTVPEPQGLSGDPVADPVSSFCAMPTLPRSVSAIFARPRQSGTARWNMASAKDWASALCGSCGSCGCTRHAVSLPGHALDQPRSRTSPIVSGFSITVVLQPSTPPCSARCHRRRWRGRHCGW